MWTKMKKNNKKSIYSLCLDGYIDLSDIAEIIVFNDFPNSDIGYFSVYGVILKNGFKWFNGNVSWTYTDWVNNLDNLALYLKNQYNEEIELRKIGVLYTKPDTSISNDDLFWDDLWRKIIKKANKLAKEIYEAQKLVDKEKKEQSIII